MEFKVNYFFKLKYDKMSRYLNMIPTQQKVPFGAGDSKWLELVVQHVKSLRYGVVEIVVHDSRVIQIEKTERVRLDKTETRPDQT